MSAYICKAGIYLTDVLYTFTMLSNEDIDSNGVPQKSFH